MRIFVLEDDFSQQARIETTIEKLLKKQSIIPEPTEKVTLLLLIK